MSVTATWGLCRRSVRSSVDVNPQLSPTMPPSPGFRQRRVSLLSWRDGLSSFRDTNFLSCIAADNTVRITMQGQDPDFFSRYTIQDLSGASVHCFCALPIDLPAAQRSDPELINAIKRLTSSSSSNTLFRLRSA